MLERIKIRGCNGQIASRPCCFGVKTFCLDIAKMHDASNRFLVRKGLLNATHWVLALLLFLGAGVFLWSSNKGFDFTDEGLYLLVYQHPQEFPDSYTSYHRVGAVFFDLVGGNIIALRLLGFFLTALATFYFSLALTWFLKGRSLSIFEDRGERILLHLALQGSVLTAYCWLPPTPNYNTMAGIGMLLSCGGILAFFSNTDAHRSIARASWGILTIGGGVLLAFLAKGSSAVGIVLVSMMLIGACSLIALKEKIFFLVVVSISVVAGGLLLFFLMPSLSSSWDFFIGSIVALTEGNGAREIIIRHWQESLQFGMRHIRSFMLPVLLAAGVCFFARSRFLVKSPDRKESLVFWSIIGVLIVEVVLLIVKDAFSAGIQGRSRSFIGYTSLFLVLLTLRAGLSGAAQTISPYRLGGCLVFLAWLALMPFVTAAGTTHKIFINALLHLAPLSAAILLLAASLDKSLRRVAVLPFAGLLIVGLGFSQFITGFVLTPYRTAAKWAQTVPVEVGVPPTILNLDPASAECIKQTKSALADAGFEPGDDLLALYGLPGLVYAVGGVSPRKPWFFDDHGQTGDEENLRALKSISKDRLKAAFVFRSNGDERVEYQLGQCGVSFSNNFQVIDKVNVPFKNQSVEVLKPSLQNTSEM